MRTAARTVDELAATIVRGLLDAMLFATPTAFAPIFAFASVFAAAPIFALAFVSAVVVASAKVKEHKTPPVVYVRSIRGAFLYYSVCARKRRGEEN